MERQEFSEGQVHEAVVTLRGAGLTPGGLQRLVNSKRLAEKTVSLLEEVRVPVMEVCLKQDYQNPPDHSRQVFLPAGTKVVVRWISEKSTDGSHHIQFITKDEDPAWVVDRTWDDVEHPKNCTVVQNPLGARMAKAGNYGVGNIMDFVYCANRNEFMGIEVARKDIEHCPLCGKNL